ncbi:Sec20-domain-containing protein [Rhizodiscina lignyota]|uniref:Sec20-domain-containing protein n=1 Tax=Rhizodiscina lignyota TaxID=1504668 RepID=A0A9P4IEW0_9PEZI|nr:Sec20-domain-containing protein [Rhizodiscina lignyota]
MAMGAQAQSIFARLTTVSENNKSTIQLIHKLGKTDEGDLREELSSEIHDSLNQQEDELELLRQDAEDATAGATPTSARHRNSERDREKTRLNIQVARLGEDLRQSRIQFRKAQIQAKRNAQLAKQQERHLRLVSIQEGSKSGNTTPVPGRKRGQEKLTQDELVASASTDVTAALRRTQQLMQTELSRSQFAQETLDQSTQALGDLSERYTDLDTLLSSSKTLLSTLVRSQKSDTWYLETTFYILLATISWLVFRRFLYGPLWWLLWLPLKLVYKSLVLIFVGAGAGVAGSSASVSPSTSLIVKPSAKGRSPERPVGAQFQQPYIPVGRGGYGAGQVPDPSVLGSISQQVGQMAEETRKSEQPKPDKKDEEKKDEPVRRGDGTILEESDAPRNPKKRMFDAKVEQEKYEAEQRKKDEL